MTSNIIFEAGYATELMPDCLTQMTWRWGHLDTGYVLMWGTSWRPKSHIKTKIPFVAALLKHINNPMWWNFIFFNNDCC